MKLLKKLKNKLKIALGRNKKKNSFGANGKRLSDNRIDQLAAANERRTPRRRTKRRIHHSEADHEKSAQSPTKRRRSSRLKKLSTPIRSPPSPSVLRSPGSPRNLKTPRRQLSFRETSDSPQKAAIPVRTPSRKSVRNSLPQTPRTPGGTRSLYQELSVPQSKSALPIAVKRAVDFLVSYQLHMKVPIFGLFTVNSSVTPSLMENMKAHFEAGNVPACNDNNFQRAAAIFVDHLFNMSKPVLPESVWRLDSKRFGKEILKQVLGVAEFYKLREIFEILTILVRKNKLKSRAYVWYAQMLTPALTHQASNEQAETAVIKLLTDCDNIFF